MNTLTHQTLCPNVQQYKWHVYDHQTQLQYRTFQLCYCFIQTWNIWQCTCYNVHIARFNTCIAVYIRFDWRDIVAEMCDILLHDKCLVMYRMQTEATNDSSGPSLYPRNMLRSWELMCAFVHSCVISSRMALVSRGSLSFLSSRQWLNSASSWHT